MSNAKETVKVDGGEVTFDWGTGAMTAKWDNGYTEKWGRRGCDIETKALSFLMFTEQYERARQYQ